jgi:alkylation response protein AidB-like acyl-CoA dehydrogenase
MNFRLTEEQEKQRQEFYSVCRELEKKKPPTYIGLEAMFKRDENWAFHLYCAREFAKRNWLSLGWPAEYGGTGTMMDRVIFAEARGYYGIPGVDLVGVQMLAPTLISAGSEEMKKKFLPPIAKAEVMWAELWSEPDAGSDLAMIRSTAVRKGDEYILNGQKTWSSGANRADWGFGIFVTDPKAKKHHNMSFLLFELRSPGITVRPLQYMDGESALNEIFFEDAHIQAQNIVGKEHEGWDVVNVLASFERSGIDYLMEMVRWIEELTEFCNENKRNGIPLSKDPIIRNRLASIACELESARTLAYRVADLQNRNEMSLIDAAAVKVFSSEIGERLVNLATDIMGPFGQVKYSKWSTHNGLWEKMYQEYFVPIISMGTNEIQRNIIAWYGLGLPRMK